MKQKSFKPVTALAAADEEHAAFAASLGASEASIRALLREGASQNTRRTYRSALAYWIAWHKARFDTRLPFPTPVKVVLQFVADHVSHATPTGPATDLPMAVEAALIAAGAKRASGVLALATVRQRLAVLSEAHEAQGVPNPCRTRAVGLVMERTRRAYAKRGVRPARKEALTREPLEALLATCDASAIGYRDRALLLFAWASGGRRRSEVVAATFENVHRVEGGFLYLLGASKTKPTGAEHADQAKPVVGRAAEALEAWLVLLAEAGIATGAIFRRVRRGGHIGEALGPEAVRRLVQARAAQAGLTGDFAAHSLRSGFVTEAGRLRLPLAEVMVMTGHASMASVVGYHRTGAALTSRVAHMLDIVPPTELSSVEPREN